MPVDHPDKPRERQPAAYGRTINVAIGFFVVFVLLLVLVPLLRIPAYMA